MALFAFCVMRRDSAKHHTFGGCTPRWGGYDPQIRTRPRFLYDASNRQVSSSYVHLRCTSSRTAENSVHYHYNHKHVSYNISPFWCTNRQNPAVQDRVQDMSLISTENEFPRLLNQHKTSHSMANIAVTIMSDGTSFIPVNNCWSTDISTLCLKKKFKPLHSL